MSVTDTWHPSMGTGRPSVRDRAPAPSASTASWVLASVALVILALVALWVTHSAVFRVRTLSVSGNNHLSRGAVLRLAGVNDHTNVLWLSTGGVERRLTDSPWILTAHVSRTLPTSISISISERIAVARVRSGQRVYLVSRDGMVLGSARLPAGLPVIDVRGASVRIGSKLRAATGALGAIANLPLSIRSRIREAIGERDRGLVLLLRGGVRAIYGNGSAPAAKGEALAAVLAWGRRHGVSLAYVDVRAPVTPAAGPSVQAAPTPATTLVAGKDPGASPSPSPRSTGTATATTPGR
jgi:cell division protein FtsQ